MTAVPPPAVHLSGITKRFGSHTAVDSLDLTVPEGSVYGFIGPNGSGKTTTMRMILHIILADEGKVEVLGRQQFRAANNEIAYLPEERGVYRKLTVNRQLQYFASLKGMHGREVKERIADWLDRMNLSDYANKKIETLSKGMSQKVQFISAVLTEPKLLILDEPFSGLDPVNLEVIREAIAEIRSRGTTIIFSTHDMNTAERMCDRIFMIYKGQKVLDGTLDDIQKTYGEDTLRVRYDASEDFDLAALPGVDAVRDLGRFQEIRFSGDPQQVLQGLLAAATVHHFEVIHPTLHDIFVRIAAPKPEDMMEPSTEEVA